MHGTEYGPRLYGLSSILAADNRFNSTEKYKSDDYRSILGEKSFFFFCWRQIVKDADDWAKTKKKDDELTLDRGECVERSWVTFRIEWCNNYVKRKVSARPYSEQRITHIRMYDTH